MFLLGPDQLLGGGLANGFGQPLAGQRVSGGQDPVVQRLTRRVHRHLHRWRRHKPIGVKTSNFFSISFETNDLTRCENVWLAVKWNGSWGRFLLQLNWPYVSSRRAGFQDFLPNTKLLKWSRFLMELETYFSGTRFTIWQIFQELT